MVMREVLRYARSVLVLAISTLLVTLILAPGARGNTVHATAGPWTLVSARQVPAGSADQGVATVQPPHGAARIVTRGGHDVPTSLRARGWWHIGDPGSTHGYLLDAYQGRAAMRAKLFMLTAPDGRRTEWIHELAPGEAINNSFVAVAPSGRWFVSGEWGTMTRLLVFPTPGFNAAARSGHDLPLATTIRLTHPIRNVQGCSFASATQLVCATNDTSTDLFGVARQLIGVDLTHPTDGHMQSGRPVLLGVVPQVSGCGVAETEGLDVHGGRLLLVAHEPGLCSGQSVLFTYRARHRDLATLRFAHAYPGR